MVNISHLFFEEVDIYQETHTPNDYMGQTKTRELVHSDVACRLSSKGKSIFVAESGAWELCDYKIHTHIQLTEGDIVVNGDDEYRIMRVYPAPAYEETNHYRSYLQKLK